MDEKYAQYLLQKTKEDYNLIAEEFSRARQVPWEELRFLAGYIKEGDKVLDLGCGNGRLLEFFKNKNIEYVGIDNSEKLIEIAQKKYPGKKFLITDALNLPFPEGYFDIAFLIAFLHHIPSENFRLKILQEAKRVLKSGGLLVLTVWDFWRKDAIKLILEYSFLKLVRKSRLDFKDVFVPWGEKTGRYYHYFAKRELIDLIEGLGFKIKKLGVAKNKTGKRSNIYLIAEK